MKKKKKKTRGKYNKEEKEKERGRTRERNKKKSKTEGGWTCGKRRKMKLIGRKERIGRKMTKKRQKK